MEHSRSWWVHVGRHDQIDVNTPLENLHRLDEEHLSLAHMERAQLCTKHLHAVGGMPKDLTLS